MDGVLARDWMWVTPHVVDKTGSGTVNSIAQAFVTNLLSYLKTTPAVRCKIYLEDFNPSQPHPPLADISGGTASSSVTSAAPREICLCLSYFATNNVKRQRGRLFLPWSWVHANETTPSSPATRPTAGQMGTAGNFYTQVIKQSCSTTGTAWTVASHVDRIGRDVTGWWIDDEWDTIRSRGLRSTTRQTGVVP